MSLPENSILNSDQVMSIINNISNINIEEYISIARITQYAQGVISFASGIFDIFVSLIVSVYLLLERKQIVSFFRRLIESSFSNLFIVEE